MITTTARLQFRTITAADRDALFAIYADKETMKYRGSKPLESREDAARMVAKTIRDYSSSGACRLAIADTSGTLIGTFLYKTLNETDCEIGYSIGKDYQGRGYATEALHHMISFLQNLGYKHLFAATHPDNTASSKLLLKAGFHRVENTGTDQLHFAKTI